jgi:hypothetical protein
VAKRSISEIDLRCSYRSLHAFCYQKKWRSSDSIIFQESGLLIAIKRCAWRRKQKTFAIENIIRPLSFVLLPLFSFLCSLTSVLFPLFFSHLCSLSFVLLSPLFSFLCSSLTSVLFPLFFSHLCSLSFVLLSPLFSFLCGWLTVLSFLFILCVCVDVACHCG